MVGDVGLLWPINEMKTLEANVDDGLLAHFKKFGKDAEFVEMHPDVLNGQIIIRNGVCVKAVNDRLKRELFIGRHAAEEDR